MQNLAGKVALVTGGGRGLGASISRKIGATGATVIVADLNHDQAQKTADDISHAGKSMALSLDIGNEEQSYRAIDKIKAEIGGIDILINNAGTDQTVPIEEMSVESWDRIMSTNLRAPFLLSKLCLPIMKERGGGYIINIASTAAKRCWANASAYHASKWGVLGFSHALHVEARPHNIKVSAVVCGGMKTPFLLDRFPDIDITTLQDPNNVADVVLFLLAQPPGTVIPEIMVLPMQETSWP